MPQEFQFVLFFIKGAYGCGKCVGPNTRVATPDGYRRIVELVSNPKEGYNDFITKVPTRKGLKETSKFYKESSCKLNILNLNNGETINGTGKHRVLAFHDNKVALWRTDELKVGDYILFFS